MKKFATLLLTLFFLFFINNSAFAQNSTPDPTPPPSDSTASTPSSGWELDPPAEEINGNTPSVTIRFYGLNEETDWHFCSIRGGDGCHAAEDTVSDVGEFINGVLTIEVCGASDNKLKEAADERCNEEGEEDYFHEGRVYQMALYEDEEQEVNGPVASFFVNHHYPTASVQMENGLLQVKVGGELRRPGTENRNNYQIVVEGDDLYGNKYKEDECIAVQDSSGASILFGKNQDEEGGGSKTRLSKGEYLIKINERINEGGIRSAFDSCNGGFTYWHINITVNEKGEIITVNEKGEEVVTNPPACIPSAIVAEPFRNDFCIQDPNNSDLGNYNEFINSLFDSKTIALPCADSASEQAANEGHCSAINTALGEIPTNIQGFIQRLFTIVLSIAGVAALGLLIYGGYVYMTSRGDPERIKGARETITSAIIGLLFIVFSFVILQVIGADILRIPGFGTVTPQTPAPFCPIGESAGGENIYTCANNCGAFGGSSTSDYRCNTGMECCIRPAN